MNSKRILMLIMLMCLGEAIFADTDRDASVLDKLFSKSMHHIFNINHDTLMVWLAHQQGKLTYRTTYPFSSIGMAGYYRLATQVSGAITINASNVTLDLNGNTVTGGITVVGGNSNIMIQNGTVEVSTVSLNGITVNSGCTGITIDQVTVKNGASGIRMTSCRDSIVSNCEMLLNVTGIELTSCRNIIVQNCTASRNVQTGFGLLLSSTCSITGCRASATGSGNTDQINTTICGFLASNGSANLFDNCIANGTQALTTTDYNSVVAGFAFTGTEQLSYITNCQSVNTITRPSSGVTVPYGIVLQGTMSSLTSLTVVSTGSVNDSVSAIAWRPDAAYLAVGGTLGGADLCIYQLNSYTNSLVLTATFDFGSTDTVFTAQWSPDARYIAVGGALSSNDLRVLEFIPASPALTQVASANTGSTSDVVYATAWNPNGNYIAVGGDLTTNDLRLYFMDRVNLSLTQTLSTNFGSSTDIVRTVAWSPDGRWLAVGGTSTSEELKLYYFSLGTVQLGQIAAVDFASDTILSLAWSPDGNYLAAGGGITGNDLYIYRFSLIGSTYTLTPITNTLGATSVNSLSWSPTGQFLAVGGLLSGNDVLVYYFDRGASTLNLVQSTSPGGTGSDTVRAVAWSPDGGYIAAGGTITGTTTFDLALLRALRFPSNNVISNNFVSNTSGSVLPAGIGISGSSILNYIVGNTSYNNPNAPFSAYTNYAGVCNVFNSLFFQEPSLLQNLDQGGLVLIPQVDVYPLRIARVLSMADDIQTKVNILVAGSPL